MGALLALLLLSYAFDWLVWNLQAKHRKRLSSVAITRFVIAPLKGNKVEYYNDGAIDEPCSISVFGQGGTLPCWWLRRHQIIYE